MITAARCGEPARAACAATGPPDISAPSLTGGRSGVVAPGELGGSPCPPQLVPTHSIPPPSTDIFFSLLILLNKGRRRGREHRVRPDRAMGCCPCYSGQLPWCLADDRDPRPSRLGRHVGDRTSSQRRSLPRPVYSPARIVQGGLPRPVRPHQGYHLAAADLDETSCSDGSPLPVADGDARPATSCELRRIAGGAGRRDPGPWRPRRTTLVREVQSFLEHWLTCTSAAGGRGGRPGAAPPGPRRQGDVPVQPHAEHREHSWRCEAAEGAAVTLVAVCCRRPELRRCAPYAAIRDSPADQERRIVNERARPVRARRSGCPDVLAAGRSRAREPGQVATDRCIAWKN